MSQLVKVSNFLKGYLKIPQTDNDLSEKFNTTWHIVGTQ